MASKTWIVENLVIHKPICCNRILEDYFIDLVYNYQINLVSNENNLIKVKISIKAKHDTFMSRG